MIQLFPDYQKTLQHEHGWEVPLECPQCESVSVPAFNGWTPSTSIRLGSKPTIFANLSCPRCATDLRTAAGVKLVELFADMPIPASNRRLLRWYIGYAVIATVVAVVAMLVPLFAGRNIPRLAMLVVIPLVLLRPLGQWLNYAVASHRKRPCGEPVYKFMGLLGRTYCYRCSSCGELLRLRD